MNTKNEVALLHLSLQISRFHLAAQHKGLIVRQRCQRAIVRGGKKIPQIIGLSKDEADSLPSSNTISQHVRTHLNGTAIDPGGQERGFSHQRDSFLLKHKNIINPYMQLKGIIKHNVRIKTILNWNCLIYTHLHLICDVYCTFFFYCFCAVLLL